MPQEIELKLALGNQGALRLRQHPALAELPGQRETLINTYYDTPDGALEAAKIALRIRRTPHRILQTLKTAGQGSGGLSSRGEWEWQLSDGNLDLAGLAQLAPIRALGVDALDSLQPCYTTDFERHSWLFEYADAKIEVALDQGEIRAGGRRVSIDELELELKSGGRRSGDPAALWQLALQFAEQVPLRPANASKAARGTALRDTSWQVPRDANTLLARFDQAIDCLDALTDSGDAMFRRYAREALEAMAEDAAGHAEIVKHAHAMSQALAMLDWLTLRFGQHSLALRMALQPLNHDSRN